MKVPEGNPVKLCSVTVLYNPQETVFDYLSSYLGMVQKAYIIDNSDVTGDLAAALKDLFGSDKICYTRNDANTGIAAALNKGCSLARADGYNWILTMDQDSYFDDHRFFELAMPTMQQDNIAIIGASYSSKMPFKNYYSAEFNRVLFVVTSGNLVNIDSWQQVGGFNEKLFIDEVDNDFCLRLNRRKYLVLSSVEIFLRHSLGVSFSIRLPFSGKDLPIGIHSPHRMYFTVRNGFYVMKKYAIFKPAFSINRLMHLSIKFFLIIFYYPKKKQYGWNYYKGMRDFIWCRFSNDG